ncbi:hypothetical protein J6590_011014 [Homalodisca vitripennis]|nr:hypothetical protein J6590_011014 [Homalodisca vitripennis]
MIKILHELTDYSNGRMSLLGCRDLTTVAAGYDGRGRFSVTRPRSQCYGGSGSGTGLRSWRI